MGKLQKVLSEIRKNANLLELNHSHSLTGSETENDVPVQTCELMPPQALNLLGHRVQSAAPTIIKPEPLGGGFKTNFEVSVIPKPGVENDSPNSPVTTGSAVDPTTPPPLVNQDGRVLDDVDFDSKGKPLDPSKSSDNENKDPSFDPAKSPPEGNRKRKDAKKLPWHDKLVLGGKMSGARDTRVKLNEESGKWEAKIRLDAILPFTSLGFFDTKEEANEAAKNRLKHRNVGVPQDLGPRKISTRTRTGHIKPRSPKLFERIRSPGRPKLAKTRRKKGKKRGRPRIRSIAGHRTPPLRVPLAPYGKGKISNATTAKGELIQQALSSFNLPCPANSYNKRAYRPPSLKIMGNPYESQVSRPTKKIKTENGLPSPIKSEYSSAIKRQDSALRHFNVQEQMRSQIREAFSTKQMAESRLAQGGTAGERRAILLKHARELDSSISTLFDALEQHEKKISQDGSGDESEKDVKDTKELMKQLVQRRAEVGKQQLLLENEKAKVTDQVWLRDVLNKSNKQIDALRRKRYSFDGPTTIEFVARQMGWNPFTGLPTDVQSYFANYLSGSVLKFECEFWNGGSKVVAENICKIIKECTNYSPEKMDLIYRTFLVYLQP